MTVAVIITYFQRLLLKLLTTGIVIKRFSYTNSLMDLENNFKNIQNVTKVFKRHFQMFWMLKQQQGFTPSS